MLLDRRVVNVPAQREIDADLAEYQTLSTKTRAVFGGAGVEAACPDVEAQDPYESAVDAITNILHHIDDLAGWDLPLGDAARALDLALTHFRAERNA